MGVCLMASSTLDGEVIYQVKDMKVAA